MSPHHSSRASWAVWAFGAVVIVPGARGDEPHHHAPLPHGVLHAAHGPVTLLGGPPDHGVPIYENLAFTGFLYSLGNVVIADDLHMASGGEMTAFSFGYYGTAAFCGGFWGGEATVRFYQNNASNTLLPGAATLLATYSIPISSSGGGPYIMHVDLPTPVALPPDVWMGISFSPVPGGSGAITAPGVPTLGSSLNAHFTGQSGYVTAPHTFAYANYVFGVYVPAPGAPGLVALGALALTRRNRPRAR